MRQPTSSKPRKQHKWNHTMPLHKRQNLLSVRLTPELQEKYKRRNISVKKGDMVRVVRGDFSGVKGEVTDINLGTTKVFVDGINATKTDGTQVPRPIVPSNLVITDIDLDDEKRRKILERKDIEVNE